MTQETLTPQLAAAGVAQPAPSTTRALLAGGAIAGPFFVALVLIQLFIRDGYDLRRHPVSLLSVGDLGWIQITAFVASGLLSLGLAVGMRRVLRPGRGGTWGPLLVGAYGVGLVAGGVFVADPALGFPPGAPEGIPDTLSWHATVHSIAPFVAFNAVILACFVFVRRFVGLRQWGWVWYTASTAVAALALTVWPDQAGISVRLFVAVALTFAWETAFAVHLIAKSSVDTAA